MMKSTERLTVTNKLCLLSIKKGTQHLYLAEIVAML